MNDSLQLFIENDISIEMGKNYFIIGDNGVGKSSFIKNILLPQINLASSNKFLFFYSEQDISVQFKIMQAYYIGLKKNEKSFSSHEEALGFLKNKYLEADFYVNKHIVFILDEIDQYINLNQFMEDLNNENATVILTTHNQNRINCIKSPTILPIKKQSDNLSIL